MSISSQSSVMYYPGYSQVQVKENLIVRQIEVISNTYPMVVGTTENHGYVLGMMIKFSIPKQFGMNELNDLDGQVVALTDKFLAISIDSTNFSLFSYPSSLPSAYVQPSIIPNSSGSYLPPKPLPYGNQNSFQGVFFNNGALNNPINGI